ncbi:MAG: hypothetical protein ACKVP3_12340 [Hyphomicrobiaceae bacterium]
MSTGTGKTKQSAAGRRDAPVQVLRELCTLPDQPEVGTGRQYKRSDFPSLSPMAHRLGPPLCITIVKAGDLVAQMTRTFDDVLNIREIRNALI